MMRIHNLLTRSSTRRRARQQSQSNFNPQFDQRQEQNLQPRTSFFSRHSRHLQSSNPQSLSDQHNLFNNGRVSNAQLSPRVLSRERRETGVRQNLHFHSRINHRSHHNHHQQQQQSSSQTTQKPIYIYPGLLRIVRDKAIALDNQCPAVVYKCRECRRERMRASMSATESEEEQDINKLRNSTTTVCSHRTACAICLDEFHNKDLVRKLPCNSNHIFHSKCILDWFISNHRCPLCIQPVLHTCHKRDVNAVSNIETTEVEVNEDESNDEGFQNLRRNRSFRTRRSRRFRRASRRYSLSEDSAERDMNRPNRLQGQTSQTNNQSCPVHNVTTEHVPNQRGSLNEVNTNANTAKEKKTSSEKEKSSKKSKGPRTYSYIVHDNVRMELNTIRYV